MAFLPFARRGAIRGEAARNEAVARPWAQPVVNLYWATAGLVGALSAFCILLAAGAAEVTWLYDNNSVSRISGRAATRFRFNERTTHVKSHPSSQHLARFDAQAKVFVKNELRKVLFIGRFASHSYFGEIVGDRADEQRVPADPDSADGLAFDSDGNMWTEDQRAKSRVSTGL